MANYKGPTEGGAGGKKGHSNMEHWTHTEELKDASSKRRRQDDVHYSREGVAESQKKSIRPVRR